ncbi:MAG: hypothetical protein AAGC55_26285, partial [Myxococcota bacterium]
ENCSFETGNLDGWSVFDSPDPFHPVSVERAGLSPGYGFFSSRPTDGQFALVTGFDSSIPYLIGIGRELQLPSSSAIILSFDYRAAWDMLTYGGPTSLPRRFTVDVWSQNFELLRSTVVLTASPENQTPDTGELSGQVDLSEFAGQTIFLEFNWDIPESQTGPGFFQLDNIAIQVQ